MDRAMTMDKRQYITQKRSGDRVMMNRMKKRFYWILGFALVLVFCRVQETHAASADVTIFTRAEDIHVGDTFYVMISVVSEMPVSDVELTVPIDSKKLKFTTGGDVAAATKSKITITDIGSDTAETTKIYALGFEAKKKGDFVFHIESPFAVYAYDASSDTRIQLPVSFNELPVTILKKGAKASASPNPSADPNASVPPQTADSPGRSPLPDSSAQPQPDGAPGDAAGPGTLTEPGTVEPGESENPEESPEGGLSLQPDIPVSQDKSADASAEPGTSVSPGPSSQGETVHQGSIWTNILIGIIVIVIAGSLIAAGYFIIKLLR